MGDWTLITVVLLIVAVTEIHIGSAFPYPQAGDTVGDDSSNSIQVQKREDDDNGPPDPNIPLLEQLAAKLSKEWFNEDVLLAQKLDRINDISKYYDPANNSTIIFERQTLDANKQVVVLKASEDKRGTISSKKRTYTVLYRAPPDPEVKNAFYYMIFAYIRDARPTDDIKEVQTVGGQKVTVEWDIWDDRVPSPPFHGGWPNCGYTILFSCQVNEAAIEAAVGKDLKAAEDKHDTTSPKPPTTAVSPGTPAPASTDIIKADGGTDPLEYYDLYGDFDCKWDGKSGRSLFGSSMFGAGATPAKPAAKPAAANSFFTSAGSFFSGSKKAKKVKTATTTSTSSTASSSSWIPGLSGFFGGGPAATGPPPKPASNADAVFGTYYKGLAGTPAIFLPDGGDPLPILFVPDKETYTVHGTYVPGQTGYPDSFTPDNAAQTANVFGVPGTMIPDGMTMASITGGIHGSLTGDSYKPDTLGNGMWFNPDGPEAKGVWTSYKKISNAAKPKATSSGEMITYGVEFPGVAGSSDIFIPDGQGLPGFFVPNDPAHPEVKIMPHGSFVATKPAGHGSFFPDNMKEVASVNQVRGAFMPDGMNLTGAIGGLITKEGNAYVFVVDVPGIDYSYVKSNASTAMWTPFLKPGEWKPAVPATPAPGAAAPAPAAESPAKKKTNAGFMFGIKFPSMGTLEVFIPDDYPVEGQMIPEDAEKYKPMQGQLMGVGKTPEKVVFRVKDPSQLVGIIGMPAMFVPDGIAPGNGIMGSLAVEGGNKENASYIAEPPGKGYWFIKGKPENANIWTPFTPPVLPPKPTLVEKMATQPFSQGYYVPGLSGTEPVFVPEDGAVGCFVPDDAAVPKSCGTYYPEKPGIPPEFVEDTPGTLKDAVPGSFVPHLATGADAANKFHATFAAANTAEAAPASLKPDSAPYKGWAQPEVKIQKEAKRTSAAAVAAISTTNATWEAKHPSNIGVPVGGGFSGFPTNNHGMAALVEPNHPVFKEFLQYKARQDKSIDTNEKVVMVNSKDQIPNPPTPGTTFVDLDEYRNYVNERYVIKTTHIKTLDFEEQLEIAIPKAAEKYVKKKKKKNININLDIVSAANAGANAAAGGGAGGTAGGTGSGGVKGTKGGKDCSAGWSSTASATAKAENGSSSQAEANAINGGDAHAMSVSKDGGNATSGANVKDGGKSNAMALASNGAQTDAEANALDGGNANALARKSKENSTGTAISNAKGGGVQNGSECEGGGMPDEIEVDSHAAATALSGSGGAGGNTVNSVANTNVKIDMAGLAAKVMEMQAKLGDDDDDDDDAPARAVNIKINAASGSSSGAAGRAFGGFDDPESQTEKMARVSKLGKALQRAGLRMQVGWKTELRKIEPKVTLEFENEIFYGLGNCPFHHVDPVSDKGPEQIIDYYVKILRLECNEKVKPRIMRLFNEGFLNFDSEMSYLIIPAGNEIMKRPKITDSELRLLSTAFEFAVFTSTYHEQVLATASKSVAVYEAPEVGLPPASRSVRFVIEMALNFVTSSRTQAPHHYVRLTRNLLTTLRSVMLKTFQDGVLVSGVPGCEADVNSNHNDQIQLMGLLQFLVHGTVKFEQGKDTDLRIAFKQFLVLNKATLQSRVKDYEKQAPKPT